MLPAIESVISSIVAVMWGSSDPISRVVARVDGIYPQLRNVPTFTCKSAANFVWLKPQADANAA